MAFPIVTTLVKIASILSKVSVIADSARAVANQLPKFGSGKAGDLAEFRERVNKLESASAEQARLLHDLSLEVSALAGSLRRVLGYAVVSSVLALIAIVLAVILAIESRS